MIDWSGPSGKHFISSKQGYNVSINRVNGKDLYGAWPPKPTKGEVHQALDYKRSLAAAQRLCEEHYQNQRRQR